MNKRHLHHVWRFYRHVKPRYFVVLIIVFGAISLVSLRHNNIQMIKLRDAVYAADKNGGDVEGTLRKLRQYVYGHMNTSLATGPNAVHPPIQLKYTYERLQSQQQVATGQGSALYTQAQGYCEGQTNIGSEVISCIQQYIASHGGQVATVPDSLYKFDFISAKWSPDLAGWSIVITVIAIFGLLITAPYQWWAKKYLD
jgi:preprotein translocase subunit SecF